MQNILIGKGSFLAGAVIGTGLSKDWRLLSHQDIDNHREDLRKANCVINFAFHPSLRDQAYDAAKDIDSTLSGLIGPQTHYIMLSTRMVYGESLPGPRPFQETDNCVPTSPYGTNKLEIENRLKDRIDPQKLTVLRPSNIFGFEPERVTFMGAALTRLKKNGTMLFDIAPDSKRDFLPLDRFSAMVCKIAENPIGGIYNVGSGVPLSCDDICSWLIEGYGAGEAVYTAASTKGQFLLNMAKTIKTYDLPETTRADLQTECIECGRKLRYL